MSADEVYKLMVVEDDAPLAEMVADFLASQGFIVSIVGRGDTAVQRIVSENPDAVVLDVNLPGLDGIAVCREVRPRYKGPIIILTARGSEVDEVVSLEVGADDYMAKPVRPRALLARLRVHLRRVGDSSSVDAPQPIHVGDLTVDEAARRAEISGETLELTTAEFDLLLALAGNAGRVMSRQELYQRLHGMKFDGIDRSIDLRVSRLRKKLNDDPAQPERIKSVRGVGYILPIEQ